MVIPKKKLFVEAMKNGNKDVFLSLLPHLKITPEATLRILKRNMKWKHDFILKSLFLKKYIRSSSAIKELLYFAIYNKYELGVIQALKKGANPNASYKLKPLPLTFAIKHGNIDIIKILSQYGANVNQPDRNGDKPISEALTNANTEIIDLFLSHGAILDQELLDKGLVYAGKQNNLDLVNRFILMGAKFKNSTYFGCTFSNPSVIPYLLKRDFSFNLNYDPKVNFCRLAAHFGHFTVLKEYIKYGKPRTNEDELRKTLSDALISAAKHGHVEIVKFLIGHGADINFVYHNQTAYDASKESGYFQLAVLIKKLGGKSYKEIEKRA